MSGRLIWVDEVVNWNATNNNCLVGNFRWDEQLWRCLSQLFMKSFYTWCLQPPEILNTLVKAIFEAFLRIFQSCRHPVSNKSVILCNWSTVDKPKSTTFSAADRGDAGRCLYNILNVHASRVDCTIIIIASNPRFVRSAWTLLSPGCRAVSGTPCQ